MKTAPVALGASIAVLGGALLIGCGGGAPGTSLTSGTGITTGTNGTGTNTTGTNGTTTGTTGTTTGTTGGPTTPGALPVDRILFSDGDGTASVLRRLAADGTDAGVVAQYGANIVAVAPNPQTANVYAFAARPTTDPQQGPVTLYRGSSTVDPATFTPLTTQTFAFVDDLAFSPDGTIVFFIARGDNDDPKLYRIPVSGGTPQLIDAAEGFFSVSPVGQQLVYSKLNVNGDGTDVFVRGYTASSPARKLTSVVAENILASFDRTGTKIVYSSNFGGSYDLYTVPSAGGTPERITQTPDLDEFGAAYNDDGTRLAFSALSQNVGGSGIYVSDANGDNASQILQNTALNFDLYWTSKLGRGIASGAPAGFRLSRPNLRKHR